MAKYGVIETDEHAPSTFINIEVVDTFPINHPQLVEAGGGATDEGQNPQAHDSLMYDMSPKQMEDKLSTPILIF